MIELHPTLKVRVHVMNKEKGYLSISYRHKGSDYSQDQLKQLCGFRLEFTPNVTPLQIKKIEKKWQCRLQHGGHTFITKELL